MPLVRMVSGRFLSLSRLKPEDLEIVEIAHHLSLINRWGGAVAGEYSVLRHSLEASLRVAQGFELEALLHDATEGLMGCDLIAPIKRECPEFEKIEGRVCRVIAERWGVPFQMSPEVREVDLRLRATEERDLMHGPVTYKNPYRAKIAYLSRDQTLQLFLNRFEQLTGEPVNYWRDLNRLIREARSDAA